MKWRSSKNGYLYALMAAVLVILIVPAAFLSSGRYSAFASGVQAAGVLVALILALITLDADRHDKRVDRVLALHQELVTGEIEGLPGSADRPPAETWRRAPDHDRDSG